MTSDQIETFVAASAALQAEVEQILDLADAMRVHMDAINQRLTQVHRATAKLRRTDERGMMGALNSVSAANQRHQSLGGNLRELEAAISNTENTYRDLRMLHPEVVAAVRERFAAVSAETAAAPTPTEEPVP